MKRKFPWIYHLKLILIKCGLNNIWESQDFINPKWLKATVKQKLKDLFINEWFSLVETSSNATFYRIFKTKFGFEPYICKQNKYLHYLVKFRTRNHRLPIETGNWNRTPLNERVCRHCRNKLGDEFHYLFECNLFEEDRKKYLKSYFYRHPNVFKLEKLINTDNKRELFNLILFVKKIVIQLK